MVLKAILKLGTVLTSQMGFINSSLVRFVLSPQFCLVRSGCHDLKPDRISPATVRAMGWIKFWPLELMA